MHFPELENYMLASAGILDQNNITLQVKLKAFTSLCQR